MIDKATLILHPDNSIYHLHLRPDQLAPVVITVGDPERVAAVSQHFDTIHHTVAYREFVTHTGTLGNMPISVVSTGIGTDNLDIVMNELDALVNIDFETREIKQSLTQLHIIRVGTCGAFQANLPVDSMLASQCAIGIEGMAYHYALPELTENMALRDAFVGHMGDYSNILRPYASHADPELLALLNQGLYTGITLTAPGFYGPQARQLRLPLRYPKAFNRLTEFSYEGEPLSHFEMETAALYSLGAAMGHRCASINAVAANRLTGQFSPDIQASLQSTIRLVLERLTAAWDQKHPALYPQTDSPPTPR